MTMIEVEYMSRAYAMLYEIENTMRKFIQRRMEDTYGLTWYHTAHKHVGLRRPRKPFERYFLHELEQSYLRVYPTFDFLPQEFFGSLHDLYPIRNLIAHSHCLPKSNSKPLVNPTDSY
jgi:hypothetical protein